MKRLCVITGTRAEFGLLNPLMEMLNKDSDIDMKVVATGMHLSPEFGLTYRDIENAGYNIDKKVNMLLSSDSKSSIVKSVGLATILFSETYDDLEPDAVIVLGDRYEMLAAVSAAYLMSIPVIHLYGGETTEGAYDEGIRHSISKMSYLHFTATEDYRKRVIQLGEDPKRVYNVGAIGIDNIKRLKLLTRSEVQENLGIKWKDKVCLITYHPVTLSNESSLIQIRELFKALDRFQELTIIFTMPNSDTDGRVIIDEINRYSSNRDNCFAFTSLGQLRYLSMIKHADVVIGNSSSGIVEVPSFNKPTVNIGIRQKGRISAESVIDCGIYENDIVKAINTALSARHIEVCRNTTNPYGDGNTTEKIYKHIKENLYTLSTEKHFYNL